MIYRISKQTPPLHEKLLGRRHTKEPEHCRISFLGSQQNSQQWQQDHTCQDGVRATALSVRDYNTEPAAEPVSTGSLKRVSEGKTGI